MEEIDSNNWTEFPVCPHCGFEDKDVFVEGNYDERGFDQWCGMCSENYMVKVYIEIAFKTAKTLEDLE